MLKTRDLSGFLDYILIFVTIYNSATPISGMHYNSWSIYSFVFMAVVYVLKCGHKISRRPLMLFLVMGGMLLATMVLTRDEDTTHYMGRILNLSTALLCCNIVSKDEFCKVFSNIMCFLAAFSLVNYIYFNLNPSAVWSLPMITFGGNAGSTRTVATVGYLHFFHVNGSQTLANQAWAGAEVIRNAGMFNEPGMYQVFLNLAIALQIKELFIETYEKQKKSIVLRIILLSIVVCTTVSTTGIVVLMCYILGLLSSKRVRYTLHAVFSNSTLLKVVFPIACIGLGVAVVKMSPIVFGKFFQGTVNYGSYAARSSNTLKDLTAWLESPIWGIGVSKYESLYGGTENGITCTLACYGFPIVLVSSVGLYKFLSDGKNYLNNILFVGMLFSLATQNIYFSLFMATLYFYGVSSNLQLCKDEGEIYNESTSSKCLRRM